METTQATADAGTKHVSLAPQSASLLPLTDSDGVGAAALSAPPNASVAMFSDHDEEATAPSTINAVGSDESPDENGGTSAEQSATSGGNEASSEEEAEGEADEGLSLLDRLDRRQNAVLNELDALNERVLSLMKRLHDERQAEPASDVDSTA